MEDIFKLSASTAASEFGEWVQVGIDVCIPHRKYQIKPHSSPWFSVACAAAIIHRNHFFCLYQQNKSSESKWSSDRLVIVAKGFVKLPKLHMLLKQKSPSLLRNLALRTFGELLTVFSTKVNLLYLLYLMDQRFGFLHLIKQSCLLKTSKNFNLDDSGISLPVFSSKTNLKLRYISRTPKMVWKIITNLDSSRVSGPDYIPVVVVNSFHMY